MNIPNFSALMREENEAVDNSWKNIYDFDSDLPQNLLSILSSCVFLPYDHYDLLACYYLVPSALCRVLPYLFIHGVSGSGKSSITKIAQHLHDVKTESSSDTFVGIRNSIQGRKYRDVRIPSGIPSQPDIWYHTEVNTMLVWDDIDPNVFTEKPDLYRLFKFGYDRTTDKIEVSSREIGQNEVFHCFCPKILSSIHPLHTNQSFKELHRRLLVIPTKKLEELDSKRKLELGIMGNSWVDTILEPDTIAWSGFHEVFRKYWDEQRSREFLVLRKDLGRRVRGLTSVQRAICLDLIATGVITGIWDGISQATSKFIEYFKWLNSDQEKFGDTLSQLLKQFMEQEESNAKIGGVDLQIHSKVVLSLVAAWTNQGLFIEKPRPRDVRTVLAELGYRQKMGVWVKE